MKELEQTVLKTLEAYGVPFEVIPCDPALADTVVFCEKYGYPPRNAGNTIIAATKKEPRRYAACVVTAPTRLDVNRTVRGLLGGTKISFATPEDTVRLTGMEMGGVTPFNLPEEMPIYVDAAIMALDYLILGCGSRSAKIKIAPEIFRRLRNASVVEGLAQPRP